MDSTLAIAFTISNFIRVLFYIPQFRKFTVAKHNLESHSLFMWGSWVIANLTVGIYFVALAGVDEKALLSFANSTMCLIGVIIIIYKRKKYKMALEISE